MNGTTDPSSVPQTPITSPSPADAEQLDLPRAVWQLRVIVCGLGLALLAVSLLFNAFVWKQNRDKKAETKGAERLRKMQARQQQLMLTVNDLAQYSLGNAELMPLFRKHGIELTPPLPTTSTNVPPAVSTR